MSEDEDNKFRFGLDSIKLYAGLSLPLAVRRQSDQVCGIHTKLAATQLMPDDGDTSKQVALHLSLAVSIYRVFQQVTSCYLRVQVFTLSP